MQRVVIVSYRKIYGIDHLVITTEGISTVDTHRHIVAHIIVG